MNWLWKFFNDHSDSLKTGFVLSVTLVITGLLVRYYEYMVVSTNFVLPDESTTTYFFSFTYDLLLFSFWGFIFFAIWLVLNRIGKNAALIITAILISLFFLIYIPIVQYFAEVLTLLGSDFYAYNFTELSDTIQTSIDLSFARIFPILFFPTLFCVLFFLFLKLKWPAMLSGFGMILILLLASAHLFLSPDEDRFENELDYAISVNNASYFFKESLGHFFFQTKIPTYEGEEFPLLKEPDTKDVLGSYFEHRKRPPNLVFVIVEGLGGTLMPPHASYGGFTPFLDSLASNSLYWTHFLATSGRSFNAQPSIFGSLPYGKNGFMEMGALMPEHHSLISILNDNGYLTSYFGGYDTRFDKLDQFLERQQLDLLVNSSRFPQEYQKMDEIEGGFTWGYADKDVYRRAFDFIDEFDFRTPRLDIFFSLNFHEPFIIHNRKFYNDQFWNRLARMDISERKQAEYLRYEDLFTALLYTDSSIRELINRYKKRADYDNTIFIITGDHRMIPVPHRDRLARYYVPLIIYSPMLNEGRQFSGVSTHLDITPTLLAYLNVNYNLQLPEQVHWLGGELSTSTAFTSSKQIGFMRTKNTIPDYLSGDYYLSGNQLFRLNEGMEVDAVVNPEIMSNLKNEFREFIALNMYVTSQNKLLPVTEEQQALREQIASEKQELGRYSSLNAEELFFTARELAFNGDYDEAQLILSFILRENPNFHDARLLLGRTQAWNENYETAEIQFDDVLKRNPEIIEVYEAKADLYYWQGKNFESLSIANKGLEKDEDYIPLIFRKARALMLLDEIEEAKTLIERGLQLEPDHPQLLELKSSL